MADIELSVVVPVFNEASLLQSSAEELRRALLARGIAHEIILAENGSTDATALQAQSLAARYDEVFTFSYPEPNYGGALREGIFRARGRYVLCEEIDLCDVAFLDRALPLLREDRADLVIGSKALPLSRDTRPIQRRFATKVYNRVLRAALGFRGTDTHGLKAFSRARLLSIVESCVVEHDVFASELVIRAQRGGLRVREIPVRVHEKRAPSVHLLRRVPRVVRNLAQLVASIHLLPGQRNVSPEPAVTEGRRPPSQPTDHE